MSKQEVGDKFEKLSGARVFSYETFEFLISFYDIFHVFPKAGFVQVYMARAFFFGSL